jgi:hypothetical protein
MPSMSFDAIAFAIRHHAASTGARVDRTRAEQAFRSGEADPQVVPFVRAHLWEAEPEELLDLVAAGQSSFAALHRLAEHLLPDGHANRVFLSDRAGIRAAP